jgi:multidrug efflux pump subunit AcrA (membrane-fusion protein)
MTDSWNMRRLGWVAALALAATAAVLIRSGRLAGAPRARADGWVSVKRGEIRVTALAGGVVAPHRRIGVKALVPCRVEDVLVREGEAVVKNQVLARVGSPERTAILDSIRLRGAVDEDRWLDMYKPIQLMAPIAGTVISCPGEPGQALGAEAEIVVLADFMAIKAQVDERDSGQFHVGQTARVSLDALPGVAFTARVFRVAGEVRTINNVAAVEFALESPQMPPSARNGAAVTVRFLVNARKDVLVLPRDAVIDRDGKTFVLLRTDDGTGSLREVRIGLQDEDQAEVVAGLDEGEQVLARGSAGLLNAPGGRRPDSPLLPFSRRAGR